ncbi:hypothetical protein [Marinicauda sp. Alg238-R41]|uniref:hypothetical protein n=1 Tax=Marinicauda sp. Alg238-R41 TaxID=2993447 RepID=UPI0022E3A948|nr:hypothetical protein [Marinicauda sp. Alg238-R41]
MARDLFQSTAPAHRAEPSPEFRRIATGEDLFDVRADIFARLDDLVFEAGHVRGRIDGRWRDLTFDEARRAGPNPHRRANAVRRTQPQRSAR